MSIEVITEPVLVTGATGRQGGAVAAALLERGVPVRALVRDPDAAPAITLRARGAVLVRGNLDDPGSLRIACEGARAVFSVQHPNMADPESDSERVQGKNLVEAARAAGVPQFIHTSVSGAGTHHRRAPGWELERDHIRNYWESKAYTEELVKNAGFRFWTLIKPSFFMENFIRPSMMFEGGTGDRLLTTLLPHTEVALVAVQDIGAAAAAAIQEPSRFHGVELELASERLTMREIARALSRALDLPIEAPSLTPDEAIARGLMPVIARSHARLNHHGSPATPEAARALGIPLTDFETWLRHHPL
ncbi:NmrA/HSCARG family protein [Polyangium aurulentum]|uniref:NmrA/HSCARG family protein n=1 Tax=Polyangium aurulentum TaxID=2567896 RepID=UPI001980D61A|nr:NmrA/HSCARG family protein [Polyangium aurulentum]UQA60494.1 NmrA/HSCARG family protein [Polyangium aurulentum]